jgi:hypothetical protein
MSAAGAAGFFIVAGLLDVLKLWRDFFQKALLIVDYKSPVRGSGATQTVTVTYTEQVPAPGFVTQQPYARIRNEYSTPAQPILALPPPDHTTMRKITRTHTATTVSNPTASVNLDEVGDHSGERLGQESLVV